MSWSILIAASDVSCFTGRLPILSPSLYFHPGVYLTDILDLR